MAERGGQDGQERTEAPTPRRREEAAKEGQVPHSQELSNAVTLLVATPVLLGVGGTIIATQTAGLLQVATGALRGGPLSLDGAMALLVATARTVLLAVLPVLGSVMVVAVASGLAQGRGVITLKRLEPKLEKFSPIAGLKRMFGLQAFLTLAKSLLKLGALGWVAWMVLADDWVELINAGAAEPEHVAALLKTLGGALALKTGAAFLVIAGLDYGVEVWRHERGLRMSRQELIEEQKETDGSPLVKSRMRSLAQSMARRRMLADVTKADVVITNPTHIAVALKYDPLGAGAPVVLAMGERKLAERIKHLAREAGIPMVENRPLARALLATCKVGRTIPADLYTAVAEVLAWVYRRRGWRPA